MSDDVVMSFCVAGVALCDIRRVSGAFFRELAGSYGIRCAEMPTTEPGGPAEQQGVPVSV